MTDNGEKLKMFGGLEIKKGAIEKMMGWLSFECRQTKLRAARAFKLFLNYIDGHTLKVNKDRQLLFMLKLHNMR